MTMSSDLMMMMTMMMMKFQLRRVTWWTRHDKMDPEETDSEDDFAEDDEIKITTLSKYCTLCLGYVTAH